MPSEPKKPIEELLEASARARRTEFGADPKMPNPMRTQLHEEIARLNRNAEARPRQSWLARFWPQLSLATAAAAVLVTASTIWMRDREKPSTSGLVAMKNLPAPELKDASAALRSLEGTQVDRLAQADEAKPAEPAEAGTIVAAPPAANSTEFPEKAETRAEIAQAPAAAAKAGAPLAQARSFAASSNRSNQLQRFSQNAATEKTVARGARLKQRTNVLNTFEIAQDGDKIRVVDEDGSTYSGRLEQIAQTDARSLRSKTNQEAAPFAAKPAEKNEEFFFRAVGFNQSLKKQVVFEANYVATPPETHGKPGAKEARREEQNQARIVGTATIRGEAPVAVDAVSVTR